MSQIVGVLDSFPQVGIQHGVESRLSAGLPQPFGVAQRPGRVFFFNHRQAMLPTQLIRDHANLPVVGFGAAVIFLAGFCADGIPQDV